MKTKVIEISVCGGTATGKSAILASIKEMLESHNFAVVYQKREDRNNPPDSIQLCENHEKPKPDSTVFVLIKMN